MMRCRLALVGSFFVFCVVSCSMAVEGMQRPAVAEPAMAGVERLVSPELLKQAELEILWETKLPIKRGGGFRAIIYSLRLRSGQAWQSHLWTF